MQKIDDSGEGQGTEAGRALLSRRDILAMLGVLGLASAADAPAQDASKINPRSYRVVIENDKVRVLEYRSRPGLGICGQGRHSHPAHLTIAMTDAKVQITTEDGQTAFGENKGGEMFWSPAETHTVENLSGHSILAYLVEIKDKNWKPSTG